jgi:hypothetical protein
MATRVSTLLELVRMDVCGPMPTKSIKGFSYFVIHVNEYSKFATIYFLKHNSKVFDTFQNDQSLCRKPNHS